MKRRLGLIEDEIHSLINKNTINEINENGGIAPELFDEVCLLASSNYACLKSQAQLDVYLRKNHLENGNASIKKLGGKKLIERRHQTAVEEREHRLESAETHFITKENIYKRISEEVSTSLLSHIQRLYQENGTTLSDYVDGLIIKDERLKNLDPFTETTSIKIGTHFALSNYLNMTEANMQFSALTDILRQLYADVDRQGLKNTHADKNSSIAEIYGDELAALSEIISKLESSNAKDIKSTERLISKTSKEAETAPSMPIDYEQANKNYSTRNVLKYYGRHFGPYYMELDMSDFGFFKTKEELEQIKENLVTSLNDLNDDMHLIKKTKFYTNMLLKRFVFSGINNNTASQIVKETLENILYQIPSKSQKIGLNTNSTYIHVNELELLKLASAQLNNENINEILETISQRFDSKKSVKNNTSSGILDDGNGFVNE